MDRNFLLSTSCSDLPRKLTNVDLLISYKSLTQKKLKLQIINEKKSYMLQLKFIGVEAYPFSSLQWLKQKQRNVYIILFYNHFVFGSFCIWSTLLLIFVDFTMKEDFVPTLLTTCPSHIYSIYKGEEIVHFFVLFSKHNSRVFHLAIFTQIHLLKQV